MSGQMRGGVVVRSRSAPENGDRLWFVPADVAVGVANLASQTRVPGVRLPATGVALALGNVVTTLELPAPPPSSEGTRSGDAWEAAGLSRAVVCDVGGEQVALTGGDVVATGVFEASGCGVLWQGRTVPALDVRELYARAEAAIWTERAALVVRGGAP